MVGCFSALATKGVEICGLGSNGFDQVGDLPAIVEVTADAEILELEAAVTGARADDLDAGADLRELLYKAAQVVDGHLVVEDDDTDLPRRR